MIGDKLTLEVESDDNSAWLVFTTPAGTQLREPVRLRIGFSGEDVRAAIIATGLVRSPGNELVLASDIACGALRDLAEAILEYFDQSGAPGKVLLAIQSIVSEYDAVREWPGELSLYEIAWLDILVRDDLADEARSIRRVWGQAKIPLNVGRICERRVAEVVARNALRTESIAIGPMAPSMPTRNQAAARTQFG